ncbi:acyl-CoA dehydrogenase family protein [Streptomyces sp. NPDC050392]|uniref:acyl-CoA dehydrogenase family protein n=1 Tax=Streptomyces sp. NPDC050392 TaxID=3155782 RepID=UPI00341EFF61
MEREEFALVRDTLRVFSTRFGKESADGVEPESGAAAQLALDELGLGELRRADPPAATVQECALLAEEHGSRPMTTSLLGTVLLAPELLRLLGNGEGAHDSSLGLGLGRTDARPTIALSRDLRFAGTSSADLVAWDCSGADLALSVAPDGTVTTAELGAPVATADLVRDVRRAMPTGGVIGRLTTETHQRWQAYALTIVSSELVGSARSFVEQSIDYARDRHQYGRPIGSFQAVQHLLADATVQVEACTSATRYAAWCLDHEPPDRALTAARVAKAEVNISAVEAVHAGMQVFGGIAQTWEHVAHLFLRRVLLGATLLATTDDLLPVLAEPEETNR